MKLCIETDLTLLENGLYPEPQTLPIIFALDNNVGTSTRRKAGPQIAPRDPHKYQVLATPGTNMTRVH
jgi:hypothetical protein